MIRKSTLINEQMFESTILISQDTDLFSRLALGPLNLLRDNTRKMYEYYQRLRYGKAFWSGYSVSL